MLAFTVLSIGVAIWLSAVIARPMVRLQDAAKRVAGGDFHTQLQMHSSIREVRELNDHLERMRQELVGTKRPPAARDPRARSLRAQARRA